MDSIEERIDSIRRIIADKTERLPYADGPAYYNDIEEIGRLTKELAELREMLYHDEDQ